MIQLLFPAKLRQFSPSLTFSYTYTGPDGSFRNLGRISTRIFRPGWLFSESRPYSHPEFSAQMTFSGISAVFPPRNFGPIGSFRNLSRIPTRIFRPRWLFTESRPDFYSFFSARMALFGISAGFLLGFFGPDGSFRNLGRISTRFFRPEWLFPESQPYSYSDFSA